MIESDIVLSKYLVFLSKATVKHESSWLRVVLVDDICLIKQNKFSDVKVQEDRWFALLLGLPSESTIENLTSFLGVCSSIIHKLTVIEKENDCFKYCLLEFNSEEGRTRFQELYNELQFCNNSSQSDASSCLVLSVSPTSDEFQLKLGSQLPTCTSCLRRLAYEVSGLCSNNKFWSLWILSNMNRCGVCKAFADYQTRSSSNRIQCQRCIITENIWICLLCGAAGCGRYTLQHAKIHFEETNHPFSLELVSGRIWDYLQDSFAHNSNSLSQHLDNNFNKSAKSSGDEAIPKKFNQLSEFYDAILQSQLYDQHVYFENLLAKETSKALTSTFLQFRTESKQVKVSDTVSDEELHEIESLKTNISKTEELCRLVHEELKNVESRVRDVKADNSKIMRQQKLQSSQLCDLEDKKLEIEHKFMKEYKQKEDLEQQICDMKFYRESQLRLASSDVTQDEINGSKIIVMTKPISEASNEKRQKKKK